MGAAFGWHPSDICYLQRTAASDVLQAICRADHAGFVLVRRRLHEVTAILGMDIHEKQMLQACTKAFVWYIVQGLPMFTLMASAIMAVETMELTLVAPALL